MEVSVENTTNATTINSPTKGSNSSELRKALNIPQSPSGTDSPDSTSVCSKDEERDVCEIEQIKPFKSPTFHVSTQIKDSASFGSADDVSGENRRESIRAKLREREQRLSNLVRNSSSDSTGSFLGQMRSVQSTLEKVEKEKTELEKELDRLKHATGDDEFLKEKMNGIQEGFMKQVSIIQKLEDEIVTKKSEIDHLRDELVSKLRRIVELEFDLETHNVHYTDYADEQFKLGEEALAEINFLEMEEKTKSLIGNDSDGSIGASRKLVMPRKASKLIAKLLSDLDSLEARFKKAELESVSKIEATSHENAELRTRIKVLENRLETKNSNTRDDDDGESCSGSVDMTNVIYLRKRVETLEAERALNATEVKTVQSELEEAKKEFASESKKSKIQVDRLTLINGALKSRLGQLETKGDPQAAHFAIVEKRISENYDEIAKLETELDIKERQVATLKKDVTKLRIQGAANGSKDNTFTALDRELLGSNSSLSGVTQITDSTYVNELQRQLHAVQQQLVKKDQELVIERAKAASTAAGLLARITEITGRGKEQPETGKEETGKENEQTGKGKEGEQKVKRRRNRFRL